MLATYQFLGLGTNVEVKYQAAGNLMLTYENGGTGDAGDKYTGLDRFGRLVETIWKIGSDKKVHSTYGRNRFGGVVWRKDEKAHAVSKTTQDNFYWYDGFYQVQQHQRGDLNSGSTGIESPPVQNEVWNYDEMGNWLAYDTEVPSLAQTRDYNKANELTSITNPSSVVQPNYDFAGNMTTMPKAGSWTTECTLKWDAWHRLVELTQGSDDPIRYTYDALTRRIITDGSEYRQYYYDDQWRAVEEHVGATPAVDCDYVWGVLGRWDMVRRRSGTSLATSHFVLKDYLDPVAIADADGDVLERYGYDAFGPVRFMDNNFDPTTSGESDYAWNFLFHAEFLDAETGLYNYGYRYYHPQLGRWLSRDPISSVSPTNEFFFTSNLPNESIDIYGGAVAAIAGEYVCQHSPPPSPSPTQPFANFGTAIAQITLTQESDATSDPIPCDESRYNCAGLATHTYRNMTKEQTKTWLAANCFPINCDADCCSKFPQPYCTKCRYYELEAITIVLRAQGGEWVRIKNDKKRERGPDWHITCGEGIVPQKWGIWMISQADAVCKSNQEFPQIHNQHTKQSRYIVSIPQGYPHCYCCNR